MRKHYFLDRSGDKKGPFSIEDLKKEVIYDDDLIWNNEIEEWTSAKNLNEISYIVIVRPPKTPKELIDEKIINDNILIRNAVIKRVGSGFLIFSIILTFMAYYGTQKFISYTLDLNDGKRLYFAKDSSIFTRSIEAFQGDSYIVGWEYENPGFLFLYLLLSSMLFFSVFFVPVGVLYYFMNKSNKSHYNLE